MSRLGRRGYSSKGCRFRRTRPRDGSRMFRGCHGAPSPPTARRRRSSPASPLPPASTCFLSHRFGMVPSHLGTVDLIGVDGDLFQAWRQSPSPGPVLFPPIPNLFTLGRATALLACLGSGRFAGTERDLFPSLRIVDLPQQGPAAHFQLLVMHDGPLSRRTAAVSVVVGVVLMATASAVITIVPGTTKAVTMAGAIIAIIIVIGIAPLFHSIFHAPFPFEFIPKAASTRSPLGHVLFFERITFTSLLGASRVVTPIPSGPPSVRGSWSRVAPSAPRPAPRVARLPHKVCVAVEISRNSLSRGSRRGFLPQP